MAASNDAEEKYLQLFLGYLNTSLGNVTNIFSPASIELGLPDKLATLSDSIRKLLNTANNNGDASSSTWSLNLSTTDSSDVYTNSRPSCEENNPKLNNLENYLRLHTTVEAKELLNTTQNTLRSTLLADPPGTVLTNNKKIDVCVSKLRDTSLSDDETKRTVLFLVENTDMTHIIEAGDAYECSVCKTTISNTIRLMEHIHGQRHKLKSFEKLNPLAPPFIKELDPEEFHCEICDTMLYGPREAVIRYHLEAAHREAHKCFRRQPVGLREFYVPPPMREPAEAAIRHHLEADHRKAYKCVRRQPVGLHEFYVPPPMREPAEFKQEVADASFRTSPGYQNPDVRPEQQICTRLEDPMLVVKNELESFETRFAAMKQIVQDVEGVPYKDSNITIDENCMDFRCKICLCNLRNPHAVVQHVTGKRHRSYLSVTTTRAAIKKIGKDVEGVPFKDSNITFDEYGVGYWCKICRCSLKNLQSVVQHITGKRHTLAGESNFGHGIVVQECIKHESLDTEETAMRQIVEDVEGVPYEDGNIKLGNNGKGYWCNICLCSLDTPDVVMKHVTGRRHSLALE